MGKENGNKVIKIELGLIIGLLVIIVFDKNFNFINNKEKNNQDENKDNYNNEDNNSNNFRW